MTSSWYPLRYLLLHDGRVVGCFRQTKAIDHLVPSNSSSSPPTKSQQHCHCLLLLEPSGAYYTFVDSSGNETRGTTRFVVHSLKQRMCSCLRFRNSYCDQPYICQELFKADFTYKSDLRCVRWYVILLSESA